MLLDELDRKRAALDITDYRTFTALVNEYYADPDRVMDRLDDRAAGEDGDGANGDGSDGDGTDETGTDEAGTNRTAAAGVGSANDGSGDR